jgi:acetoacetyl-[acyl-carrier protein] synthase
MSKTPIPCIVGFGGVTPAGRASHNLSYTRLTYSLESEQNKLDYIKSVLSLCNMTDEIGESQTLESFAADKENDVLANTLVRKIEKEFLREKFWSYDYDLPANGGGQLPFKLDPTEYYPSRQHPKALGMAVMGIADAFSDCGFDVRAAIDSYGRDKSGCFAGCAVMNMDRFSGEGLMAAHPLGKRASSKNISFTLPEMTADFINAYVTGSLGISGHFIGACATSQYNMNAGVELIKSGKSELVIVGASEAIIMPSAFIGFDAMGAMTTDKRLTDLQALLGEGEELDYTKYCRPFGDNMGLVVGESSGFAILMSDRLALEVGANIRGCILNVNINADGNKKSISGPGAGNYFSVGKTFSDIEEVFGDKVLKENSAFIAHGTGTPLNRITESHIVSTFAKEFGIESLPVTSLKSKLGHTMGSAGMDQLFGALGAMETNNFSGICTIPKIADDVFKDNLDFFLEDRAFDNRKDAVIINSKGFGGNNATTSVISENLTMSLLEQRYSKSDVAQWQKKREKVLDNREKERQKAINSSIDPIYEFDKDVLDLADLKVTKKGIKTTTGFNYGLDSDLKGKDFT